MNNSMRNTNRAKDVCFQSRQGFDEEPVEHLQERVSEMGSIGS